MKSYKDMADNVFSRIVEGKKIEIKKNHQRVHMASSLAVLGIAILIGLGVWLNGQLTIGEPGPNPDSETESILETENMTEERREVIFLNRITDGQGYDADEQGFTGLWSVLDFDEEIDPDALYAYKVNYLYGEQRESISKMLQEEGFLLVQDYPESGLIIAGKMEDFKRVFLHREAYKGFYLGAEAVTRPDMEEVLKEYSGDEFYYETMNTYIWFNEHFEELVPFLGTDKNRVSVEVVVSKNWTTETTELDPDLLNRILLASGHYSSPDGGMVDANGSFSNGFEFYLGCYEMMKHYPNEIYAIGIMPREFSGLGEAEARVIEAQMKEQGVPTLVHQEGGVKYVCYIFVTTKELEKIHLDNVEEYTFWHAEKSEILGTEPDACNVTKEVYFSHFGEGLVQPDVVLSGHYVALKKYSENEDALYACYVNVRRGEFEVDALERWDGESDASYEMRVKIYRAEKMAEYFMEQGLMVMPGYSYCVNNNGVLYAAREDSDFLNKQFIIGDCLVVGTYEQLMSIFDNSEKINGAYFSVGNAARYELMDWIYRAIPEEEEERVADKSEFDLITSYGLLAMEQYPDVFEGDYLKITIGLTAYEESSATTE